jgi:5-methylcytosine-specific restriction endonuclease McrA
MTTQINQFTCDEAACKAAAAAFKGTLPTNGLGTVWTIESFSTWVSKRYPWCRVEVGQEWQGVRKKIRLVCDVHGPYSPEARPVLLEKTGCQCRFCQADFSAASAGKARRPRATAAEKKRAAELYAELGNYTAVGRELGRPPNTIRCWLDPGVAEKNREKNRTWIKFNRERHNANRRRYYTFEHGKANEDLRSSTRKRQLEEDAAAWNPDDKDLTEAIYVEKDRLTRETGVAHHVDHIMPLCMGGQHAWWNLQILTAEENLSKGGNFREEDRLLYTKRLLELIHNEKL